MRDFPPNKKPRKQSAPRPAGRARKPEVAPPEVEAQRLQKLLAQAGVGSRRDMDELIRQGRVTVNGVVAELGMRVTDADLVRVDNRTIRLNLAETLPRILLYHKPEGEIVSRGDPQGRPNVFEKLPIVRGAKWIAIGRLDFNTSGLLIFTTSGELANRLMHPRFEVEREYAVRVMGVLTPEQVRQLKKGVTLPDGPANFISVVDQGGEGANHWYRVVLKEGRNREVRRMFEAVGLMVSRLMRVRYGIVHLPPRLKRGLWLELEEDEVKQMLQWTGMGPETPEPKPKRAAATRSRKTG